MNNNNNNNSSSNTKEAEKQRAVEEIDRSKSFMNVIQGHAELIQKRDGNNNVGDGGFNLQDSERAVLQKINNFGLMEGAIATVAAFVFIRKSPPLIARYIVRRRLQQQQQQHHQHPPTTTQQPTSSNPFQANQQQQNAIEQQLEQMNTNTSNADIPLAFRVLRFVFDATLSLMVGANISLKMADADKIIQKLTDIPLLEGRSTISDEFCPVLIQEYQRQTIEYGRKDVENKFLNAYLTFCQNCMKRQAVEERIRQETGLDKDTPVSIPSPGVRVMNTTNDDFNNNMILQPDEADRFTQDEPRFFEDDYNNNNNNDSNEKTWFDNDTPEEENNGEKTNK